MTFDFCCQVIDWNPDCIRAEVLKRVPVPRRFQNRSLAANRGWLSRHGLTEKDDLYAEAGF